MSQYSIKAKKKLFTHRKRQIPQASDYSIKEVLFITISLVTFLIGSFQYGQITLRKQNMGQAISTSAAPIVQSSTTPTGASRRDLLDMQMVQNVLLIWLDANIDENNSDCQNTISHLRQVINTISIFTDSEKCIDFLDDIADEKACMIISGSLGQRIISRVHDLCQVDSIFIFCANKNYHEEWAKNWSKIKGVFTAIQPICDALKQATRQCEQNAISISIMDADDILFNKSLDQLDPSFMYTQIMKEILLTINFEQHHIDDFIQHCHKTLTGNTSELEHVDNLAKTYSQHTPIWWYTLECFLYPMLNRALRTMDANVMIKLGFFICDLHRQITQLHHEQFGSHCSTQHFAVYRGQGMEKKAFEKLAASKGGLISFNCFLSTSRDRQISLDFAEGALDNPQLMGVLFVITIDSAPCETPFASVVDVGVFGAEEDEILFSMHTVFRIGQVTGINSNPRLVRVELTMTSDKDKDLHKLINRIREETFPAEEGWFRLGLVLGKMGESAKAEEVFKILLKQMNDESAMGMTYHQLGVMTNDLGKYEEAIGYYEKSIEIEETRAPRNLQNIANSYNDIGWAYYSTGNYAKALEFYEKALKIRRDSLSPNHPDIASCYHRMGSVYSSTGDYPKALSSYVKSLAIRQQSLPSTHPDLANSYNNIGNVYSSMSDYLRALSSHENALTIWQQSLPSTHPDLATSYNNIGNVYYNIGNYTKALSSYEKSLAIRQQSLPSVHPDLAMSHNNIGNVYCSMADYPKALSSHEKALAIWQQSLPSTHPDLAMSHNNVGNVYCSMGDYPKALSSYEKALAIRQQALTSTHPDLAMSYNSIGNVHCNMGDYPKALSSYEKSLAIRQQALPSTHPDLANSYNNIGNVYDSMSDYSKALSSHEKALEIWQQSLPSIHPDLATSYNNIGNVYYNMGDYPKALSSYENSLTIRQQSLPYSHPDLAMSHNNIGNVYYNMGDYPKALSSYENSLTIRQQSLPSTHPDLAMSYNNIGNVYYNMGDYSKALSCHEKALAIRQQSLPPTHPHLAMSYNNMGLVHENMGNYSETHSYYERAVDIAQHSLPSNHPELQEFRDNLAFIKEML